jgi:flagellar hook-basal body complex protein FliE
MLNGIQTTGLAKPGLTSGGAASSAGEGTGASFSDVLRDSIDEVARLQQDASQATQDLLTGRTEDVTGVFAAMEKSDIAFKTLLAIRGKLMDAFDEIRNMPI